MKTTRTPMSWWRPKSSKTIAYGFCSDIGRVRAENEDAYGCFPGDAAAKTDEHLFIVADGMGGHTRGQQASRAAVQVTSQTYFSTGGGSVSERLQRAFEAANRSIYQLAFQDGQSDAMGTTCTALALTDGQIHLAHVGDSRAFRISRRGTEQLTRDHTIVEERRREGILTDAEARAHPNRNVLRRAMGINPTLEVDVSSAGSLQPGDCYVLCTDGLTDVADVEMQQIVLALPPQRACDKLVEMANERGGFDNVTVMVIRID